MDRIKLGKPDRIKLGKPDRIKLGKPDRIKLGILQVNHDKSTEVGDAFPDDAHRFRDLFDVQDERFRYRVYMTIGGELPLSIDEQDAFLITGSPLSVLDEHLFSSSLNDFIKRCDAAKKPLLGSCFGHQAIAQALGGTVERSTGGYNIGIEQTQFIGKRSWMSPARDSLSMYVFHEDQVTALPAGCEHLGTSTHCKFSSFAKGDHIFTTQAHPEFTHPFMNCVLDYLEPKLEPATVSNARATMSQNVDGDVFANWCTCFFKGG